MTLLATALPPLPLSTCVTPNGLGWFS